MLDEQKVIIQVKIKLRKTILTNIGFSKLLKTISYMKTVENIVLDISNTNLKKVDSNSLNSIVNFKNLKYFTLVLSNCNIGSNNLMDLLQIGIRSFKKKKDKLRMNLQL